MSEEGVIGFLLGSVIGLLNGYFMGLSKGRNNGLQEALNILKGKDEQRDDNGV